MGRFLPQSRIVAFPLKFLSAPSLPDIMTPVKERETTADRLLIHVCPFLGHPKIDMLPDTLLANMIRFC